MEHEGGTHEILGIVVDNTGTGNEVEVDVLYPALVLEVVVIDARLLVADTGQQGEIGYPILGKDPVIAIAEAQTIVGILDVVELETVTQLVENGRGKLLVIETDVMLRVGESCHERTGTAPLVGGLAIGGRIGELLVIEYPVGIQSLDSAFQTIEMNVFQRRRIQVEPFKGAELEVASRLAVIEVDTEFRTIEIEGYFLFLGLVLVSAKEVFNIECIAQEYPSPTEIDAELGSQSRGKVQLLGILADIVP